MWQSGYALKANKPGLYRQLFEVDCKVPKGRVMDIDWIGNSVMLIWVEKMYEVTFKQLIEEGG